MRSLINYFFIPIFLVILAVMGNSSLHAQENTTVGGYGELHYNEPDGSSKGQLDFHRFIIYLGHSFNDQLSFKSELELEHTKIEAGSPDGGEIALEQAYLDWHFNQNIGLRAGILLPPVGIINQFHEPPIFNGVERPNVDRNVIPSTWRESGAGIYGSLSEGVNYQLYLMAGLKADGLSGSSGIRGGRQSGFESSPLNPSFTGRLDYIPQPDLRLGGSFYFGNTTEGIDSIGSGTVTLISGDVQYSIEKLSLRAVGAFISIADADKINAAYGNSVGDNIYGFYIEGAYDIMPYLCEESEHSLSPFLRYEKYNTQASVTGFTANENYDRNEITLGLTYKPTYNTVFKLDYQFLNNAAENNSKLLNVGIGYNF
ncbi:MAG: hypothetical protein EPO24_07135 [Bacteroidetes bacterium]|nr:MAG: hypothetical protein EPO24_07135 [Bacteroidota bacterium]